MIKALVLVLGATSLAASAGATALTGHLGVDSGLHFLKTDAAGEVAKKGFGGVGKLGLLLETRSWDLELDAGMRYSSLSGTQNGEAVYIRFFSFWSELSPRYRVSQNLSLGPWAGYAFGSDNTHQEILDSSRKTDFLMAGASTRYHLASSHFSLVARMGVSLDLVDRQASFLELGLLYHFGSTNADRIKDVVAVERRKDPAPALPTVDLRLPANTLLYKRWKTELDADKKRIVKHIAALLFENSKQWNNISIVGHSDLRGPERTNALLSEARASAVRAELISLKIDPERIVWAGRGSREPLEPGESADTRMKNRRVELVVQGLVIGSDLEAQLKAFNPLKLEGY
jgi:outer membrane protein OmpA-like peptidoglycan-associated protein